MKNLAYVADKLGRLDYRQEPSSNLIQFMKDNNLVAITGKSDDLLYMFGKYEEEFGAYNGFCHKEASENNECKEMKILSSCEVNMEWSPGGDLSWMVSSNNLCPVMAYSTYDSSSVFCIGLVIDITSLIE